MNNNLRQFGWAGILAIVLGVLPVVAWNGLAPLQNWQSLPHASVALSSGDQFALVLAVYGFKSAYMLLSMLVLAIIWKEREETWLALKGSLAAFWLGEFFCGINILFYVEEALVFEYLHSFFMVMCLGLLFYSVMEVVDGHILHFSNPRERCALAGVCKTCIKAKLELPGTCLLRRLFQWMIPLAGVIACMPLTAQPLNYSFSTQVFGLERILTHLMPIQWYELRFSPAAALVLMAAAWLALAWKGTTPTGLRTSKILLSAGVGQLGFSLMRLAFASFYREGLVWFIFWEELTELLLVIGVLVVITLVQPGLAGQLRTKLNEISG